MGFKQNFGQASGEDPSGYIYKLKMYTPANGGYVLFDNGLCFLYGTHDPSTGSASTHQVDFHPDLIGSGSAHRLEFVSGILIGPCNVDDNSLYGDWGGVGSQHCHLHSSYDARGQYPTYFKYFTREGTGVSTSAPGPIGMVNWFAMGTHIVQST